jgi:hypothetical protein
MKIIQGLMSTLLGFLPKYILFLFFSPSAVHFHPFMDFPAGELFNRIPLGLQ